MTQSGPQASVQWDRLAWLSGSIALALAWLPPSRYPPWRTFDGEFVAAAVCAVLFLITVVTGRARAWHWPPAAVGVAAVATVPWIQWGLGLLTYSGDALMASAYLLGLSTAIAVGHRLASAAQATALAFVDALMRALAIAALLSSAMALVQWLRWQPAFGDAVSALHPGTRPYANLGQPNQLATLLGWGLVALWWGWLRGGLAPRLATVAAAFLLMGLAATQSRTAWLFMALLPLALWALRGPLQARRARSVVIALGLTFALLVLLWDRIDAALGLHVATSLEDRLQAGLREQNWRILIDGLMQRPLSGYGWQQLHAAQQATMLDHPSTGENLDHAHNLVLDLLIWNGIPLGSLLAVGGLVWWVRAGWAARRAVDDPAPALMWIALSMALVHAMLEYPHSYAYFLLPAGLMAGILSGRVTSAGAARPDGKTPGLRLPRVAVGVWALGLVLLLGAIHHDYRNARALLEAWRYEVLALQNPHPFAEGERPTLRWLTQVAAQLDPPKTVPGAKPDAQQLDTLRRYSERFSVGQSLLEYAKAQAQAGDLVGARQSLDRMCWLVGPKGCADLQAQWERLGEGLWPELRALKF